MAQGGRGMGGRSRTAFPGGMGWGGGMRPQILDPQVLHPRSGSFPKKNGVFRVRPLPKLWGGAVCPPRFYIYTPKRVGGTRGGPQEGAAPAAGSAAFLCPKNADFSPKTSPEPPRRATRRDPQCPLSPTPGDPPSPAEPPQRCHPAPSGCWKIKNSSAPTPPGRPHSRGVFPAPGTADSEFSTLGSHPSLP